MENISKRFLIYGIFLFFISCSSRIVFIPSAPPILPFFPEQSGVSLISPPPVILPPVKTINEIEISSQYFKIVVPLVLDKTGKLEGVKNLLDEQFTTALFETKRFTVMDKATQMNIWERQYNTNLFITQDAEETKELSQFSTISKPAIPAASGIVGGAEQNNNINPGFVQDTTTKEHLYQKTNLSASDFYGKFEFKPELYEKYLEELSKYTDGILKILITGNDETNQEIDIDYRIISSVSNIYILYSGKGKIGYSLAKGTTTKLLDRGDIMKIAEDIKQNLPDPDSESWKIIQVNTKNNSRKITVDAGKNNNIKEGMIGYVVKDEGKRYTYRAMFEVTEVFPEAFNAELKVESREKLKEKFERNIISEQEYSQYAYLINTIKVGELIKMK